MRSIVNADLSSIGNRRAVSYWSTLGTTDLTADRLEFVNDIDPGGAVLTDVDELSLANAYSAKFRANSVCAARRRCRRAAPTLASYKVTASSSQAMAICRRRTRAPSSSPSSADFYAALVSAFAQGVFDAVQTPAPSGS